MQVKNTIAYLSKILILTFNLLLLTSETTLSQTLSINYSYPRLNNSDNDKPFCYMEMQDATILDLSSLCRKTLLQNHSKTLENSSEQERIRRLCNTLSPKEMGDLRIRRRCVG